MFNSKIVFKKIRRFYRYLIFLLFMQVALSLKGIFWERSRKKFLKRDSILIQDLYYRTFGEKLPVKKKKLTWIRPVTFNAGEYLIQWLVFSFFFRIPMYVVRYTLFFAMVPYTILYEFITEAIHFYFWEFSTEFIIITVPFYWNVFLTHNFEPHYRIVLRASIFLGIKVFFVFKKARIRYKKFISRIFLFMSSRNLLGSVFNKITFWLY